MKSEITGKVVETLKVRCGVNKPIELSSRLMEDLELDSMGLLALAVSLENHYRVTLQEDPEQPPQTVGEVVDLVQSRIGNNK